MRSCTSNVAQANVIFSVHLKVYVLGILATFCQPAILGLEAYEMVFGPVCLSSLSPFCLPAFCLFYFIFILLHWQQRSSRSSTHSTGSGQRTGGDIILVDVMWGTLLTLLVWRFVGILTSHSRIIIIGVCFIWPTAAFVRESLGLSYPFLFPLRQVHSKKKCGE